MPFFYFLRKGQNSGARDQEALRLGCWRRIARGSVLKLEIGTARNGTALELGNTTTLDLYGLSSRAKFHKQYRRNGIPTNKMAARKY
jgi:hypothetical protein